MTTPSFRRAPRRASDDEYFEYEGNGVGVGDARGRDMSNAEKAALKRREAKKVPIGFQLPKAEPE